MYSISASLIFLFLTAGICHAQVLPGEGSRLNYRVVGFSFKGVVTKKGYKLQIAAGYFNSADSFDKNIFLSVPCETDKIIAEVPDFGRQYTWRAVGRGGAHGGLHHFSTGSIPVVDTANTRLRIIKKATKYKDAYVFLDGTRTLYNMNGRPVWYLPDMPGIGTPPRDMKISPQGTITFLLDKRIYEVDYNGNILWRGPNDGRVSGMQGEGYHHEFTRLASGHYMALGQKPVLWELPDTISKTVLNAPGEIIVRDSSRGKYYQKMQLGTLIEYDAVGNVVWQWCPSDYLKTSDLYYRRTAEGLFDLDVHENSFFFNGQDRTVYLSLRDVSRVVKIKYPGGDVLNSFGGTYTPGSRDVNDLFFCYQHSCRRSRDGYLYLFNNNGCHLKEYPKLVMMRQPRGPKETLKKIWEFECNVAGMDEKCPVDSVFTSGGNVVELPDGSLFASMCVRYGNVLIVGRDKKLVWNAISEKWVPGLKKWTVTGNYRASIITGQKELERLVWGGEAKK